MARTNWRPGVTGLLAVLTLAAMTGRIGAADWQPVTEELIRTEKPGFGKLCGVLVDHATGNVYVDLSEKGLYRSADQGKTWKRHGKPVVKGRTETPGCLLLDPLGKSKRLLMATVYGGPVAVSPDLGATWKFMDNKSRHVDWCAVDWTDQDMKLVLALAHEKDGLLLVSRDGGKSFGEAGKDFGPAWVFDAATAVVARVKTKTHPQAQLLRTTDGARTFTPCGDYATRALPRLRNGRLYWVVDGAVITTGDKGRTWHKLCDLKGGQYGPIFGKNDRHLFVLTGAGIVESTDGGASWSKPGRLPNGVRGALTWIEYDPRNDLLYAMSMGTELYQLSRGGKR